MPVIYPHQHCIDDLGCHICQSRKCDCPRVCKTCCDLVGHKHPEIIAVNQSDETRPPDAIWNDK